MTVATASSPRPRPDGPAVPPAPGSQPVLPPIPRGAAALARATVAQVFLHRVAARLPLRIQTPHGGMSGGGGAGSPVLVIRDEDAFYRRLGSGTAGLAEAYMAGDWDSGDLPGLFTVLAEHITALVPVPLQALRRWYIPRQPAAEDATIEGARRNIERHYDLSDDLFALFLDPSMTYSSALFAPGDTLARAQRRKIDTLLDRTGAGPGTTVLEIGSGWGELAIRAAARGAHVTTLTISPTQATTARRRAGTAGVAGRVDVQLRDYRQATGQYDVIVSVEMIEAVGDRYWPTYFTAIDKLLAPGGRAGLQAITMPHDRMLATRGGRTWIHQYIFPGGQIPSLQAITGTLRTHTTLRITADYPMGPHYARTLAEWRSRFLTATAAAAELGFGAAFQRMWNLYLAYSEAGFRAGYLDVHQLILERGLGSPAQSSPPCANGPSTPGTARPGGELP
jgi:cyclopropane-fatty-acyl-phospholipid synthase